MSIRQTALIADVGVALNANMPLPVMLQGCAEAVVRHLDAAFARIWTLERDADVLALEASAGLYTHRDGPHGRIRVGDYKIGRIAAERRPHLTNDVPHDPQVSDPDWARREGMVSFAGYPLLVDDRLVGVLALFARHALTDETLDMLGAVAQMIATGIARKQAEARQYEDTQISDVLYRVGLVLASERDLQALVQAVTDAATQLVGAQFGSFFYNVLDANGASYMLYTLSGAPRSAFADFPMPRDTAIFHPTFVGEGVVRLDDVTQDPRYGHSPPHHGMPAGHLPVRSYLAVSVVSRSGGVIGGLFFGHATPGVFTARAERLVVGVAAQAAIAIDNARLLRETQAAEARFRNLFAHVPDAILVTDREGRCIDANPAATALLGYSREELHALDPRTLSAEGPSVAEYQAAITATGIWRGERMIRRKDGTLVPVEGQATAVALPDGAGYLAVLRDISARRELEQAQRDFIAMVAHDLKNPLTALKGYAHLMQRRGSFSERGIATIVAQADRLEHLIDDLRDVARIDAGRLPLRRTAVDLIALVRAQVDATQTLAPAHTLTVEAPDTPVIGQWDRDRLAQVLENLLANAVKYSPAGGAITIVVLADAAGATVSVRDQGIGIIPNALDHLFERFYRAEGGIATDRKGLGLGLYISKAIIEAHGGTIAVTSRIPGGSTFTFTLPFGERRGGAVGSS